MAGVGDGGLIAMMVATLSWAIDSRLLHGRAVTVANRDPWRQQTGLLLVHAEGFPCGSWVRHTFPAVTLCFLFSSCMGRQAEAIAESLEAAYGEGPIAAVLFAAGLDDQSLVGEDGHRWAGVSSYYCTWWRRWGGGVEAAMVAFHPTSDWGGGALKPSTPLPTAPLASRPH